MCGGTMRYRDSADPLRPLKWLEAEHPLFLLIYLGSTGKAPRAFSTPPATCQREVDHESGPSISRDNRRYWLLCRCRGWVTPQPQGTHPIVAYGPWAGAGRDHVFHDEGRADISDGWALWKMCQGPMGVSIL